MSEQGSARVRPLLTAEQAFPALEDLADGARETLWMSFRVFDPHTPLSSTHGDGEKTWLDLLGRKLREGVAIRILLSDFDALGRAELHKASWESIRALAELSDLGELHLFPALHPAQLKSVGRAVFWPFAAAAVLHRARELNRLPPRERNVALGHMPGLWRALYLRDSGRVAWRLPAVPELTPTTLHQKLAVADNTRAIIGGIDVDERRYDTWAHDRPAEETWHDVSVQIDGAAAGHVARHFAQTWNECLEPNAEIRRAQWNAASVDAPVLDAPPSLARCPVPKTQEPEGPVRLVRTRSRAPASSELFPQAADNSLEDAHLDVIGRAKNWLYIETQFLRSSKIADALAAAGRNSDLQLVIVLPAAPEDVAFKGRRSLAERYGDYLQSRCLRMIRRAFGGRVAILSPARPVPDRTAGRHRLHGAEMIYVHSKVIIQDNDAAIVSSANLNGRSLRWDTEAGVMIEEPDAVMTLAAACYAKWHGSDVQHIRYAQAWLAQAYAERRKSPDERTSPLLPHDFKPAEDDALKVPGMPEEAV